MTPNDRVFVENLIDKLRSLQGEDEQKSFFCIAADALNYALDTNEDFFEDDLENFADGVMVFSKNGTH